MINFCTLFDSSYLSRGLAMYESLKKYCDNFHLYIFAFDDKSYDVLKKLNLSNTTIISLYEFEDPELLRVKESRTKGEYCWTCTSSTILYVMEKYNVDMCTYLDSDLYFYASPQILLEELNYKSVIITSHRYTLKYDQTATSGKYCVQFMVFKNDENGMEVLKWWRNACIDWCYARSEDGKFGDQKYLDDWPERFDCIHELEHLGGGVAPWNIQQYDIFTKDNRPFGREKISGKEFEIVFYHFHNLLFSKYGNLVSVTYELSNKARKFLYKPHINHLEKIKKNIASIDNSFNPHGQSYVSFTWRLPLRELKKYLKIILKK